MRPVPDRMWDARPGKERMAAKLTRLSRKAMLSIAGAAASVAMLDQKAKSAVQIVALRSPSPTNWPIINSPATATKAINDLASATRGQSYRNGPHVCDWYDVIDRLLDISKALNDAVKANPGKFPAHQACSRSARR